MDPYYLNHHRMFFAAFLLQLKPIAIFENEQFDFHVYCPVSEELIKYVKERTILDNMIDSYGGSFADGI